MKSSSENEDEPDRKCNCYLTLENDLYKLRFYFDFAWLWQTTCSGIFLHLTTTPLIWLPRYYGHFTLPRTKDMNFSFKCKWGSEQKISQPFSIQRNPLIRPLVNTAVGDRTVDRTLRCHQSASDHFLDKYAIVASIITSKYYNKRVLREHIVPAGLLSLSCIMWWKMPLCRRGMRDPDGIYIV